MTKAMMAFPESGKGFFYAFRFSFQEERMML